jgi:hypothetical protein
MTDEQLDYRKTLEPRVGQKLKVYPQGIDTIEGILSKGHMFYSVRGNGMLILMPGHPAILEFEDARYDLRNMR